MASRAETTSILIDASANDAAAAASLVPVVYDELRRLAGAILRDENPGRTLLATDLVHEAYLKLIDQTRATMENRQHFLAVAAQQMRRILVDAARKRTAAKRGGGEWRRITLAGVVDPADESGHDLEALEAALEEMTASYPRMGRIVEMRTFGGMTVVEVAAVLGVSERTVADDWRMAKAWLHRALARPDDTAREDRVGERGRS